MKAVTVAESRSATGVADLATLVKARLTFLVLITTLVGFLVGTTGGIDGALLAATLTGAALSACGASALNQWWERGIDARMKRTLDRPLPSGRMHEADALSLGVLLSAAGVATLALLVNPLSASLSAATIAIYVFVYTPLKQVTSLNTLVGAIPGAIPPLIGWTGAGGALTVEAWILFGIMFLWQMPHFLAIAWMYRDEYAAAGFEMLSKHDLHGYATARQSVIYSLALLAVSLLPSMLHLTSAAYFFGAFLLGAGFLACAVRFGALRNRGAARLLFFASIVYLPLLLGLLVATRVR